MKVIKILIFLFVFTISGYAFLIDDMEVIGFYTKEGPGTGSLEKVSGKVGNCMKISYDLSTGDWFQIYRNFNYISLLEGDQIRFYYKGGGNANTIEFMLEDANGVSKQTNIKRASNKPDWTEMIIPLNYFNNLDLSRVKKTKIAISKQAGDDGGSGFIIIDKIGLYQSTNKPETNLVIDDFEDTNDYTNKLGGQNYQFTNGGITSTVTVTNQASNFCTLNYKKGSGSGLASWVMKLKKKNISDFKYLKFKIKGSKGGEKIAICLKNTNWQANYVFIDDYLSGGITTAFSNVIIPLEHFPVIKNLPYAEELMIIFQDDKNESGYGSYLGKSNITIMLDDIEFYSPSSSAGFKKSIDDMEIGLKYSSWNYGSGLESKLDYSLVDGYDGKAIRLDYNLSGSQPWVWLEREFYLNLFEGGGLKFYFKGDGDANNLEVKLTDSDNTTYIRRFNKFTDTDNNWREIPIGFDELSFFIKGDDDNLNLKKIKRIDLTISKYGSGRKGEVYFDELRCETPASYYAELEDTQIIKEFKIINNPFSPNNDGYNDEVEFQFILNKRGRVNIRIYSLGGNVIKEITPSGEFLPDTEYSIKWDGKDDNNKVVRNGLYLIQFKAETPDGKIAKVNYAIAVIK